MTRVNHHRVIVLGGYGVFGSRIVRSLARHAEIEVVIAGRNRTAAQKLKDSIDSPRVRTLSVDLTKPDDIRQMLENRPAIVIDAAGPFQGREPSLARQCAENGCHYIDIADDRRWVAGITELDSVARQHNVAAISGASTVPAITSAYVDDLAPNASSVEQIHVGISPGHRAPRGLATVRAILSYCGKQIPAVIGNVEEYGWGGLSRYCFPKPIGSRWLSDVDTPERALWSARYPALRQAQVQAGLEIPSLHLGLSLLARGVRLGLLPSLDRWAKSLLAIANAFDRFGRDVGGMYVQVDYRGSEGKTQTRTATLIAEQGDGPQIPATPAALLAKKLLALPGYSPLTVRGAMPCLGLVTRQELMEELAGLAIRYQVSN